MINIYFTKNEKVKYKSISNKNAYIPSKLIEYIFKDVGGWRRLR